MPTLLLLRHASSDPSRDGGTDHQRSLNARGERDALGVGERLRILDLVPDAILSSTAVRARTTAEAVADTSGFAGVPLLDPALYLATPGTIIEVLNRLAGTPARRVLVVAHNPGLAELLAGLTEHLDSFPPAALAQIELPIASWGALDRATRGDLAGIWPRREFEGE